MKAANILAALAMVGSMLVMDAAFANNQCIQNCIAQENACRRNTQDDRRCQAEVTRCLQGCRARR